MSQTTIEQSIKKLGDIWIETYQQCIKENTSFEFSIFFKLLHYPNFPSYSNHTISLKRLQLQRFSDAMQNFGMEPILRQERKRSFVSNVCVYLGNGSFSIEENGLWQYNRTNTTPEQLLTRNQIINLFSNNKSSLERADEKIKNFLFSRKSDFLSTDSLQSIFNLLGPEKSLRNINLQSIFDFALESRHPEFDDNLICTSLDSIYHQNFPTDFLFKHRNTLLDLYGDYSKNDNALFNRMLNVRNFHFLNDTTHLISNHKTQHIYLIDHIISSIGPEDNIKLFLSQFKYLPSFFEAMKNAKELDLLQSNIKSKKSIKTSL